MTSSAPPQIALKRAYDAAHHSDGARPLVERLWPRGVTRKRARIDHWFKSLAPSPALRKWYGHTPARWPEFQRRYRRELETLADSSEMGALIELCRQGPVSFVFGARDLERNSATILREYVINAIARRA